MAHWEGLRVSFLIDTGLATIRRRVEWSLEKKLDLAPFQPYDQKAVDGVKTIFVQHYNDGIAGIGDIEGADIGKRLHRYRFSTGLEELRIEFEEHSIESFVMDIEEIKLLINDMDKKPDGKER